ncbi:MAG TPA: xanthine dehydrogenase family protein molybdopterin-binding subunit, partial [Rhodospirillales bacterium]
MPSIIGARIKRIEDEPLLRGRGRFVDDIVVPGLLHANFVRSPHPHAVIKSIDTSAATAVPGVRAVLTLDDLAAIMVNRRMVRHSNSGVSLDKAWLFALADGEVSYVGEPVAMVLADNRYIAEDATALVAVDYDVLPPVADVRQAAGGPLVRRELKSNIINTYKVGFGDIDSGFAAAAHIFKLELWQHRGGAHSIETRGLVAEHRPSDGGMTVHASTQKAHDLHQTLTSLMDFDHGLRVVAPDIGGGFGAKLCIYSEDVAVVAAAKLLGRSVKWIEDRREYFTGAVHERDQYWELEVAVDAEASILGIRGKVLHDTGAYTPQDPNIPYNSTSTMSGPYMIPALSIEVTIAMTNKTPVSSVRGAGYPQAAFAMERLVDLIACEMRIDRAEVRQRNLIPASKMPYRKPLKARSGAAIEYDSGDYPACQAEALAAAGWNQFPHRQAEARKQGRYIGIGLSHGVKGTGRGPFESGLVRISRTGRVTVFTGASAMGQGLGTALAQITASQLGIDASRVAVVAGDTGTVSLGMGGFA